MTPHELLAAATGAPDDSAERILYAAAAFNALTTNRLVLVGGGAQVTHTGVGRLTDIDLVGTISSEDERRLQAAGFGKRGRHWVYATTETTIAVEIPSDSVIGNEPPELIDVAGTALRVISINDLMMDRLVQATDRTAVTWDEALALAIATHDRINWEAIRARCDSLARTEPFLAGISAHLDRLLEAIR